MTSLFAHALFAWFATFQSGANAPVDVRVLTATSTTEFQVRRDANGLLQLDGNYRRSDSFDQPQVTGRFVRGNRQDEWRSYHPGGRRAHESSLFSAGKRRGRATRYKPDGSVLESGAFDNDHRSGVWTVAGANVVFATVEDSERGLRAFGATRNGRRDGLWRIVWPSGELQQIGSYRDGLRHGEWSFFHVDGTFDPHFVSGWYERGRRLRDATPTWSPASTKSAGYRPAPASTLDSLELATIIGPEAPRLLPRGISKTLLDAAERGERAAISELGLVVRELGAAGFGAVFDRLRTLDLGDSASVARGASLDLVLRVALHQRSFGWSPRVDRASRRANALSVLRWHSLASIHRSSRHVWSIDVPFLWRHEAREFDPFLFEPFHSTRVVAPSASAYFEQRHVSNLRTRGGTGTEQPLEDALDWLVAHQSPDGGWDCDGFMASCRLPTPTRCADAGLAGNDVGVSALALLALLGRHDAANGPHTDALLRGIGYLLDRQDPHTGVIGVGTVDVDPRSVDEAGAKPLRADGELARSCSICAGRGDLRCTLCNGTGIRLLGPSTNTKSPGACVMCKLGRIDCARCENGVARSDGAPRPSDAGSTSVAAPVQASRSGAWIYSHAIATMVLCEASVYFDSSVLRESAQNAALFLQRARNPNGVWRYDYPSIGDGDTSITGWAVLALKTAEAAGLSVDPVVFLDAREFLAVMTDPLTGRCGYSLESGAGSRSERFARINDHFPVIAGETLSAVALMNRLLLGDAPEAHPELSSYANLLNKRLPIWNTQQRSIDLHYWFWGAHATYQLGGEHWDAWNKAQRQALLHSQRQDGHAKGSWDASFDAWGFFGGRVYTTAMAALCLESYFRYPRGLGAR